MSILGLDSENAKAGRLDDPPSSWIAPILSSLREQGLFSFAGRIGRKDYWIALFCAHLVCIIAYLPFWAADEVLYPGLPWAAIYILGFVVAGGLYYWILAATLAKRLHDLNLSGWVALAYPIALGVARGQPSAWVFLSCLTFWPNGFMEEARYPYLCYLFLLTLLGVIKGAAEPSNTRRWKLVVAIVALALSGGIAEASYEYYGVYYQVPPFLSMKAQEMTFSESGVFGAEGFRLFVLDFSGGEIKQIEVPLVSQSVVDGRIETRDFGTLKVAWGGYPVNEPEIFATRSQIAKLLAFSNRPHHE